MPIDNNVLDFYLRTAYYFSRQFTNNSNYGTIIGYSSYPKTTPHNFIVGLSFWSNGKTTSITYILILVES